MAYEKICRTISNKLTKYAVTTSITKLQRNLMVKWKVSLIEILNRTIKKMQKIVLTYLQHDTQSKIKIKSSQIMFFGGHMLTYSVSETGTGSLISVTN